MERQVDHILQLNTMLLSIAIDERGTFLSAKAGVLGSGLCRMDISSTHLLSDVHLGIPAAVAAVENADIGPEMCGAIGIESPALLFPIAALTAFYRGIAVEMCEHLPRK
jgi:hypothetical protein